MKQPQTKVPKKYLDKWIAWDHYNNKIIASASTAAAALKAAQARGSRGPTWRKFSPACLSAWD